METFSLGCRGGWHHQLLHRLVLWRNPLSLKIQRAPGSLASVAKSETSAVTWSVVLGFLTSASFVFTCVLFHVHGYGGTLKLAVLCWLMVPIPLLITNALFIKLHPFVVVSHSLGWLAKLAVAAIATALLLA